MEPGRSVSRSEIISRANKRRSVLGSAMAAVMSHLAGVEQFGVGVCRCSVFSGLSRSASGYSPARSRMPSRRSHGTRPVRSLRPVSIAGKTRTARSTTRGRRFFVRKKNWSGG